MQENNQQPVKMVPGHRHTPSTQTGSLSTNASNADSEEEDSDAGAGRKGSDAGNFAAHRRAGGLIDDRSSESPLDVRSADKRVLSEGTQNTFADFNNTDQSNPLYTNDSFAGSPSDTTPRLEGHEKDRNVEDTREQLELWESDLLELEAKQRDRARNRYAQAGVHPKIAEAARLQREGKREAIKIREHLLELGLPENQMYPPIAETTYTRMARKHLSLEALREKAIEYELDAVSKLLPSSMEGSSCLCHCHCHLPGAASMFSIGMGTPN